MNGGGFSLSKFFGLSASKAKISRKIGVPLSKSGRLQKIGRSRLGKEGILSFIISMLFS